MVSDLGASFGSTGLNWMQKGNPTAYCKSKWIKIGFAGVRRFQRTFRTGGELLYQFSGNGAAPQPALARHTTSRARMPDGWDINWRDSRPQQIRDAFRAGGYSPQEVEELSNVLERRIGELEKL